MILPFLKKMQDSPRGYRIANTVFFFVSGFGYSSWASRIPDIKAQLHLSEAQFGAVLFAFPIGLMFTMPFTGKLLNKYSSRYCMLLGAVLFNIVLSMPGFAAFVWQLIIILLLFGASRNIFNLSINAQALEVQKLYPKSIMTRFHAVWSLAGFAGAGLGYVMVTQNIAPSYHLLGISVAMLAVTACFYPMSIHTEPVPVKKKFFSVPDKNLIKFALICFVSMACENTMYDWSGIYFQNILHASPKLSTAAFVFFMTAVTLGRFLGDYGVMKFGIKQILFYSGILITLGFLVCFLLPFVYPTIFGYVLIGVGVSCVVPLVFSIAGKSKSLSSGSALTSISTIGYLGFLVVPPMVGFISEFLSMKWAFLVMAVLGGIMILMVNKIGEEE
ncbi:MFS transporter [Flavobacterium sp. Fl-77]|uniref:MFS transporter n=1 Tax=Flavobacterium flavipigmentatum TaxID=2893884 RepID=A0AAJ2S7U3_9FLAO|nr:MULTISPECIES: MFS transporter [unclassified Flavobacterium]MDX6181864.1 MFS transporter [Flavobacterium sp. Fl-33]MDX6185102.1 MFS transporter [Flavobacterium sp. Fl-77]UFH37211.1 MFS transporter [Flavobacterium sp. F-70]